VYKRQVLQGYESSLPTLLTRRSELGDALIRMATEWRSGPAWSIGETRDEGRVREYSHRVTKAAARLYNASLDIARLNLRTIREIRRVLTADRRAAFDTLLNEFASEYAGQHPGDIRSRVSSQARYAMWFTRIGYMLQELGAIDDDGVFVARVFDDPAVAERVGDLYERFRREQIPPSLELEAAWAELRRLQQTVQVGTPVGNLRITLDAEEDPERAERLAEQAELGMERVMDVQGRMRDIDARFVKQLREILPRDLRSRIAA